MIVWLASYPRSGNTLCRIILKSVFERKTFSKHDDRADIGADTSTVELVGHQFLGASWADAYREMRDSSDTYFVKTHDKPEDDARAVYIVRDGRSACASFTHYLKDYPLAGMTFTPSDVVTGFTPFGSWSSHLDQWQPLTRPNTLLVKYEDLVLDPEPWITRIADFCQLQAQHAWKNNFDELHRLNPRFFRQGSTTAVRGLIDGDDLTMFWEINGEWMERLGYESVPTGIRPAAAPLRRHLASKAATLFDVALRAHMHEIWARADPDDGAHNGRLLAAEAEVAEFRKKISDVHYELEQRRQEAAWLVSLLEAASKEFTPTIIERNELAQEKIVLTDERDRLTYQVEQLNKLANRLSSELHNANFQVRVLRDRLSAVMGSRPIRWTWCAGLVRAPAWASAPLDLPAPPPAPPVSHQLPVRPELGKAETVELPKSLRDLQETARLHSAATEPMVRLLTHLKFDKQFVPRVILDVGSAKGYWTQKAAWFYPETDFYMIDPLAESEPHLKALSESNPRLHYLLVAVGDELSELRMNITPDRDGSSLLDFPESRNNEQRVVPVETLDHLLAEGRIPMPELVKIDVQGYEMKALKGATSLLGQVPIFIIEVNLFHFMPGTPLAHEVVAFMAQHGYRLYDLAGTLRRPYQDDLGQMDLVFALNKSPLVELNRWT